MASRRYRQLTFELKRLKKHFLPNSWNPIGYYSSRILDRTRAYKILVHAEIESYIEDILLEIINKEKERWLDKKKLNYLLLRFIVVFFIKCDDLSVIAELRPHKIKKNDENVIDDLISKAINEYETTISNNNGIMERDLRLLLTPTGLKVSDLDNTWLNTMNSYGGERGDYAHHSRLGIRRIEDPKTVYEKVQDLLIGLEQLDGLLIDVRDGKY